MFGSRGDEPTVELLGDDEIAVARGDALSERQRSWWPLWVAAGLVAAIGVGALLQRDSETENADGAATDETGPAPTTEAPPPSTTVPTTKAFEYDESTEDVSDEAETQTTWASTDAVATGDGVENLLAGAASVDTSELGLDGELYVWRAATLYRLDLGAGEWVEAPGDVGYRETWGPPMFGTATGIISTTGGSVRSIGRDGELLDELQSNFGPGTIATTEGSVAVLDYGFNSGDALRVHELDEAGRFVEIANLTSVSGLTFPTSLLGADGRFYVSVISGGIFEVSAPGAPRVADGFAVAAGDGSGLLRVYCGDSLEGCTMEILPTGDLDSPQRVEDGISNLSELFWQPGAWSPDLTFLAHPFLGTVASRDGQIARRLPELTGSDGVPVPTAWSRDSRWLAFPTTDTISFYDPRTEEQIEVATPWADEGRRGVAIGLAFSP